MESDEKISFSSEFHEMTEKKKSDILAQHLYTHCLYLQVQLAMLTQSY